LPRIEHDLGVGIGPAMLLEVVAPERLGVLDHHADELAQLVLAGILRRQCRLPLRIVERRVHAGRIAGQQVERIDAHRHGDDDENDDDGEAADAAAAAADRDAEAAIVEAAAESATAKSAAAAFTAAVFDIRAFLATLPSHDV